MKRQKNHKTARLIEALEYIDVRFIEEAAEKIKPRPTGQVYFATPSRKRTLQQLLALAACIALLVAAIPTITYLANHLPDIVAFFTGDETTDTDPELTHPETPPVETTVPAPETSVNTDPETTAPLYDGTTAEPEPEHDGSYGLEYKMNEDGKSAMLFHRGICTDENVIVASVWNGVPVTRISEAALAEYVKYKTVTIPESVTVIDMRAFKNCTGLESVKLHDGISYIGADAFENCVALTEITLPKSLEWIQTGLFANCINLQKVIIGNEVERIVLGAFYDCSALRELHYLGTKTEWNKIQKDLDWNAKSAITVVHCTDGDVEISPYNADEPEYDGSQGLEYKVNNDGKTASLFGIGTCTDTEIVVASTYNSLPVTEIFYNAFNGNSQIVSVIIPESVTFIEERAFANCSSLQRITLPSGLKNFGEAETFKNCTSLKTIVLPDGMNYLGVETFKGCTSLESIVMKGVGSIDTSAFEDCVKLNNIVISGKCIDISHYAFKNCRSLTKFSFDGTVNEWLKLAKGNEWSDGCPFTVIHCSDGDVNLIIEYDGSRGLEYRIEGDHAVLVGIGTCTDKEIIVASTYNGLPVTSVDYSFSKISNVTSMTLSDSVLTVGGIDNMPDLVSVYFSKNVTGINPESLIGCPNLVIIEVDKDNPKYMSSGNCLIEKATKTIVHGCKGSVIPTDGSVTVIGEFSFHGCDWLTELTIPEGIERIDAYAFAGCESLKKVNLPDSLTYLGFGAFSSCESLETISLGSSLETLSGSVFEDCPKLMELTFPKTTKLLCALAFFECKSLTKVSYEGTMAEWKAIEKTEMWSDGAAFSVIHCSDGDLELYEYDGSRGLLYVQYDSYAVLEGIGTCTDKDIVISATYNGVPVYAIADGVFRSNKNIRSISIPNAIKYIGEDAFAFCTSLESVVMPENLKTLGSDAFNGCTALTSINIPAGITEIGSHTFSGCSSLKEIAIPEGVTIIGDEAFYLCKSLKKVTLPSTLEYIQDWAFANCESLESILIPDSAKWIGQRAFSDCAKLSTLTLGEGLEQIQENAFMNCASLKSVRFPRGLKLLAAASFDGCTKLASVSYGGTTTEWSRVGKEGAEWNSEWYRGIPATKVFCTDGDVKLYSEPEYNVSAGLKYKINEDKKSATLVGIGTCTDKRLVIASSFNGLPVTAIDRTAFQNNQNITGVYIPATISTFFPDTFLNCRNLKELEIDSDHPQYYSVDNCIIHEESQTIFMGCNGSVIPSDGSVLRIGDRAFAGCSAITELTIPDGVLIIYDGAFENCVNLKKIKIPDSLTKINSAFSGCTSLEYIELPSKMERVGGFINCTSLKNIDLPKTGKLSASAFKGCTSLESVVVPSGTTLLNYIFEGCTSLKSVTLPDTLTSINYSAFTDCISLASITIPRSVTEIKGSCFKNCTSLTDFNFAGTLAEWTAIEKQDGWNENCPFTVIRCSDGDVMAGYADLANLPDAYRMVLNNESKFILDSNEIFLDEFEFPYNGKEIAYCDDVKYTVVDMDVDGEVEVVVTGDVGDMLVLHEEKGRVHGYAFTFRNMDDIKIDGTFEWNDNTAEGISYGDARLEFSDGDCKINNICHVIGDGTENAKYYVHGSLSSLDRYLNMAGIISTTEVTWYPFERYPLN